MLGLSALGFPGALTVAAQTTIPAPQIPAPTLQTTAPAPPDQPAGKVIFSRSIDENGQVTTTEPVHTAPKIDEAPTAEDAERQAVTFTALDLDVHLRPADKHMGVRARLTIRNDGAQPLAHIPLQISSALAWERIRLNGRDVPFRAAILNSDADHTGQLVEAAITLDTPLPAGATAELDVTYSGQVALNAQRLLTIGTPDEAAYHSDWDQVGAAFTGLRGFGNVVWYPVASVPVILGDGARLFDEIGQHKLRLSGAHFRLRLAVEFTHEVAPNVALINGLPAALTVTNPTDLNQEVSAVATADSGEHTLGFEAPSLFVAARTVKAAAHTTLWVLPDDEAATSAWADAALIVSPFLEGWLGQKPRTELTILDLPDARDLPYETGSLLVTGVRPAPADQLDGVMVHALAHAWMESPRAWLGEGVAGFMGSLWTEKKLGRDKALESLEAARPALALVEPSSPGEGGGEPLTQAFAPVYYRTKAAYVLWMLRGMYGDATLSAALRAYAPGADQGAGYGQPATPSPLEALLRQAAVRPAAVGNDSAAFDLAGFFADWVNADKGLPDLAISGVFPSAEDAGNWLVTVNISNTGYAAAEVPVTVYSDTSSITRRVLVPARGSVPQRLLVQGHPTRVEVNDGTVPETTATLHVTTIEQTTAGPTAPAAPEPPTIAAPPVSPHP